MKLQNLIVLLSCLFLWSCVPKKNDDGEFLKTIGYEQHFWWKEFQDPVLDALIQDLLEQNLEIKTAHLRILESQSHLAAQTTTLLPDFSLEGIFSRGNSEVGATKPLTLSKGGIRGIWDLDLFGSIKNHVSSLQAQHEAVIANCDAVKLMMISELALSVIEWKKSEEIIKKINILIDLQDQQIELIRSKVKSGLLSEVFLTRALAEKIQTATRLPIARASRDAACYKMGSLLGKDFNGIIAHLENSHKEIILPPLEIFDEFNLDSLRLRPDMRVLKSELIATSYDLKEAESELWPKVSLNAFFGLHEGSEGMRLASNPIWSLASGISVPLFNFDRLHHVVKVYDYRTQIAACHYEDGLLKALQQTQTHYTDYVQGLQLVTYQEEAQKMRQETVDLIHARFSSGLTDLTDLTTAQSELNESTILSVERKAQAASAYVRLQTALGGCTIN